MMLDGIKNEIENKIDKLIANLDINFLLKYIIFHIEEQFASKSLATHPYSQEAMAEELSFVLYRKLLSSASMLNLDTINKNNLLVLQDEYVDELDDISNLLEVRHKIGEMLLYVKRQNYKLKASSDTIKIEHNIVDYEYYYKLGYLRHQTEQKFRPILTEWARLKRFSM